jgi:hypothetical protein
MPKSVRPPNQTTLEHAEAACLWLLSAADQIDDRRAPQRQGLIDLARLVVADARESLLAGEETATSEPADQVVAHYDDWLIELVNVQLERLSRESNADSSTMLPLFSRADLELALSIRKRTAGAKP